MNAKTNTRQAAAPRAVALIAALVMAVSLFQFVATLAAPSAADLTAVSYAQGTAGSNVDR